MTPRPGQGIWTEIAARHGPASDWRQSEAWIAGEILFERGFFWEAHEVWEPVWAGLPHNSAERRFVQGMIQLANARLKRAMGRDKAADRLEKLAADLLASMAFDCRIAAKFDQLIKIMDVLAFS